MKKSSLERKRLKLAYLVHIHSNDYMETGLSTGMQNFSVIATGRIDNKYMNLHLKWLYISWMPIKKLYSNVLFSK